jgi:hypothetical protein
MLRFDYKIMAERRYNPRTAVRCHHSRLQQGSASVETVVQGTRALLDAEPAWPSLSLVTQPRHRSPDEPPPAVDIKFRQAFITHFQEEGLAGLLIGHIGTLHDLKDFKRLLAKRIQNFLSVIQHRSLMTISGDAPS